VTLSRREVLAGGLIAAGAGLLPLLRGAARSHVLELLTAQFGAQIGEHPDTRQFALDFLSARRERSFPLRDAVAFDYGLLTLPALRGARRSFDEQAVGSFLSSTNVLAAASGREAFVYFGLYDPYLQPCGNRLGNRYLSAAAGGDV